MKFVNLTSDALVLSIVTTGNFEASDISFYNCSATNLLEIVSNSSSLQNMKVASCSTAFLANIRATYDIIINRWFSIGLKEISTMFSFTANGSISINELQAIELSAVSSGGITERSVIFVHTPTLKIQNSSFGDAEGFDVIIDSAAENLVVCQVLFYGITSSAVISSDGLKTIIEDTTFDTVYTSQTAITLTDSEIILCRLSVLTFSGVNFVSFPNSKPQLSILLLDSSFHACTTKASLIYISHDNVEFSMFGCTVSNTTVSENSEFSNPPSILSMAGMGENQYSMKHCSFVDNYCTFFLLESIANQYHKSVDGIGDSGRRCFYHQLHI